MHNQDLNDCWTPDLVRKRLILAIKWVRYNAGPTGPAAVRALYPVYYPSERDRAVEGWGYPEIAEIEDDKPRPRALSPSEITAMEDALHWVGRYAVPGAPQSARVLNIWLRCKVHKHNFSDVIDNAGQMSRASAYRYRDRALAAIAMGLEKDGVKP